MDMETYMEIDPKIQDLSNGETQALGEMWSLKFFKKTTAKKR